VKYTSSGGDEYFCDRVFISNDWWMLVEDTTAMALPTYQYRESYVTTDIYLISTDPSWYKGHAYSYTLLPQQKQLKFNLNGFWSNS